MTVDTCRIDVEEEIMDPCQEKVKEYVVDHE